MKGENGMLGRRGQILVALMFFLVCVPIFKIGPISLSFFVGLLLIVYILTKRPQYISLRKDLKVLLWFAVISILSILISPVTLDFSSLYTIVQISYWLVLTIIFYNISTIVENRIIWRSIIFSLLVIGAIFILIRPQEEGGIMSENEASYIVISIWPLGLINLKKYKRIIYCIAAFIILFIIGSRTGLIIFLLQILVFLFAEKLASRKLALGVLVLLGTSILVSNERFREQIADTIFQDNYEMGVLIKNPELALQFDKSWVQRRIQQEKCKQVFTKNPFLGVGPLNGVEYNINIDVSKIDNVDDRILSAEYDRSTSRSTHNSYYQMLAENGLLGFPLIAFFLVRTIYFLYKKRYNSKTTIWILGAFLGMCVNLYMVSAFWGSLTWILLGVYAGFGKRIKQDTMLTNQ